MTNHKKLSGIKRLFWYGILCGACLSSSCESFLQLDPPNSQVSRETVFQNEGTAYSVLTGLYQSLFSGGIASGTSGSISINGALSADELLFAATSGNFGPYDEINQNAISPDNGAVAAFWSNAYSIIYGANAILSGLAGESDISEEINRQLTGEALFIRAFTYFYLVNFFGEVPLVTGTDYRENAQLGVSTVAEIYNLIDADLEHAATLLDERYPDMERFRPNHWVVRALQARIALYHEDWPTAELLSSEVINQEGLYRLAPLDEVFLKSGGEAIWQRMPHLPNSNTAEAALFFVSVQESYRLTSQLLETFDGQDGRFKRWIEPSQTVVGLVYTPGKYRALTSSVNSTEPASEYSIILRLAEQYLIRAETRARLDDLPGAMADVDKIRERAGLALIQNILPEIGKEELLDSIMAERQRELFTEWGHRWLDLKRTGRAVDVLAPAKPGFTSADMFYPIPENERIRNPNLK